MNDLKYGSGEEIRSGDNISYHAQLGVVEYVIVRKTGDPVLDWYLEQSPEGGVMLRVSGFGRVFLTDTSGVEDLEFISRGAEKRAK